MSGAVLVRLSGALAEARPMRDVALYELARVGHRRLLGEVIRVREDTATLQVYEETTGLQLGEPVEPSGSGLTVELGPGLLGAILDGTGRPLGRLAEQTGAFIKPGAEADTLEPTARWPFTPAVRVGDLVEGGDVLGTVPERPGVEHRVLVPPGVRGIVSAVVPGDFTVREDVGRLEDGTPLRLAHPWAVRRPRPVAERLPDDRPFVTGQRVFDFLFPVAEGGAVVVPGGFGTGKTVIEQSLAKYAEADIVVYIGCGERGNEMAELLHEFPRLIDGATGRSIMDRTVMIVNTSNMPVAAREASVYLGITIAEYYRDMGYRVAVMADSTSRWAEALRDISGRLGEVPAEEGYPPYLASRLAGYYERAARVRTLAGGEGSVTLISAISPPGGDLTEAVTRHTQRFTQCFWTLDKSLAEARMYPAVSLRDSYSRLPDELVAWWRATASPEWPALRTAALTMLEEAARADATARLVGADTLPERQQWLLAMARLFEDGFLRQNAYDPVDASCSPVRQFRLLRLLLRVHARGLQAVDRGATAKALAAMPVLSSIARARSEIGDDNLAALDALESEVDTACASVAPGEAAVAP